MSTITHTFPLLSRNTLQALRSAQEERRSVVSRSPTLPTAMKPQLDVELDEDGDMPFPDDTPGLILSVTFISHILPVNKSDTNRRLG